MNPTCPLFVPGDRPERFAKAVASGASFVILDLEDAVGPEKKALARDHVVAALQARRNEPYAVRINAVHTDAGQADLRALAAAPTPLAVIVPKAAAPAEAGHVVDMVRDVPVVAIVESIAGLENARAIAAAPGIVALAFGVYDLAAELGSEPTWEANTAYRAMVVLAARGRGRAVIDAPFLGIDDDAGLRAEARRAREFGFDGKLAIHPAHITALSETFMPTPAQVEFARQVVAAGAAGGAVKVNGQMIDGPIVASARRTLARAQGAT